MVLRSLLVAVAAALLCAAPARAVETGLNETLGHTKPLPRTAGQLGADWVRLWALWETMEPSPGRFDEHLIGVLNGRVAALKARGVKVLVVVHRAPGWANGGGRGGAPPPGPPAGRGLLWGGGGAAPPRRPTRRCCGPPTRRSRRPSPPTSWSPAGWSATTWTSSPRCTRTARAARSTRSACTRTPRA